VGGYGSTKHYILESVFEDYRLLGTVKMELQQMD